MRASPALRVVANGAAYRSASHRSFPVILYVTGASHATKMPAYHVLVGTTYMIGIPQYLCLTE